MKQRILNFLNGKTIFLHDFGTSLEFKTSDTNSLWQLAITGGNSGVIRSSTFISINRLTSVESTNYGTFNSYCHFVRVFNKLSKLNQDFINKIKNQKC